MNLSDKALLVQLNISQWTARKYDKRVTEQVAAQNGTTMAAGRYNKSLLPLNDYLAHVHQKASAIRQRYYANTLPWGLDGTQMLPSANYLAFMTEFRKEKSLWEQLVSDFVDNYSTLKRNAQTVLGKMYNEADYPSETDIAGRFRMDLAVMPVPSTDFRVSLSDGELTRLQADIEKRLQDASASAMKDVWQRLYDRVQHMAERLSDPTAVFRDSMVDNARELCALLPRLNFADDPNLEAMRNEVEARLTSHHPDSLRNNSLVRSSAAADAKQIMDKMSVFMGGL